MLSLLSRLDQTSAWYVELQLYVVAARVGGNVMSPNMTVWYRGARLVHLSPTGWSGVWQSPCWNSRNSRLQQFLKPFDQLHRFWFENLSDINPLAKILNPSQNLSFLSLWSYYWLRPRYGSYHWVLLNPFVFVSHDMVGRPILKRPKSWGWCNDWCPTFGLRSGVWQYQFLCFPVRWYHCQVLTKQT